jgi:ribonucleoside-diphosphate reductase beta chain
VEPAEARTQTGPSRAQREDFKATSDPALQEGGRNDVKLLDYTQLYNLWEKQQWRTQDLDFSQDRVDWHERIPADERFQRM